MPPKFSSNRLVLNKSSSSPKRGQEGHPSAAARRKQQQAGASGGSGDKKKSGSATSSESEETASDGVAHGSSTDNSSSHNTDETDDPMNMSRNTVDTDDTFDNSLDDELSDKSKSTMSTDDTFIKSMKSNLPCGLSMTHLMIVIILVPIIFLVSYSAIPLSSSISAVNFLNSQRPIVEEIIDVFLTLEQERLYVTKTHHDGKNMTTVINTLQTLPDGYRTNFSLLLDQQKLQQQLANKRALFDQSIRVLLDDITQSNAKYKREILNSVKTLSTEIAKIRQRIRDDTVDGPTIRRFYFDKAEDAYSLIMELLVDKRASDVYNEIMLFGINMRILNSFAMLRDTGFALLIGGFGVDTNQMRLKNLEYVRGMLTAIDRDVILMQAVASEAALRDLAYYSTNSDTDYTQLRKMSDDILRLSGNTTLLFNGNNDGILSVDSFIGFSERFLAAREAALRFRLNEIKEAKGVKQDSLEEILKMLGAVIACILIASLVIVLNIKEQARMDATLFATKRLAKAVQRFVPKNQLKMMGVRSIVDVQPSLAVEVANTMLASDIRDFTKLSETMENLELFDWLQQYVERMTAVVQGERGFVSSFVGDALNCIFPQPVNAVNAAINMHVSAEQLNVELVAQGVQNLVQLGIGLHYGVVVCGVFGDNTRLSTAMVASDVNLSNQLESLTKSFGTKILCSDSVAAQINIDDYDIRTMGSVKLGGNSSTGGNAQVIPIFDIFQSDPVRLKTFKRETLKDFELAVVSLEKDPGQSQKLFEKIMKLARTKGVRDYACDKLYGELMIKLMEYASVGGGSNPNPSHQQSPGAMSGFSSLQHVSSVSDAAGVVQQAGNESQSNVVSRRQSGSSVREQNLPVSGGIGLMNSNVSVIDQNRGGGTSGGNSGNSPVYYYPNSPHQQQQQQRPPQHNMSNVNTTSGGSNAAPTASVTMMMKNNQSLDTPKENAQSVTAQASSVTNNNNSNTTRDSSDSSNKRRNSSGSPLNRKVSSVTTGNTAVSSVVTDPFPASDTTPSVNGEFQNQNQNGNNNNNNNNRQQQQQQQLPPRVAITSPSMTSSKDDGDSSRRSNKTWSKQDVVKTVTNINGSSSSSSAVHANNNNNHATNDDNTSMNANSPLLAHRNNDIQNRNYPTAGDYGAGQDLITPYNKNRNHNSKPSSADDGGVRGYSFDTDNFHSGMTQKPPENSKNRSTQIMIEKMSSGGAESVATNYNSHDQIQGESSSLYTSSKRSLDEKKTQQIIRDMIDLNDNNNNNNNQSPEQMLEYYQRKSRENATNRTDDTTVYTTSDSVINNNNNNVNARVAGSQTTALFKDSDENMQQTQQQNNNNNNHQRPKDPPFTTSNGIAESVVRSGPSSMDLPGARDRSPQ